MRALLVLSFAAAAPVPAMPDWLVFEDGTRLETAGAWELRGALVIFRTATGGSLVSVRLDTVDLASSRLFTQRASNPSEAQRSADDDPAPGTDRSSTLVITDADVRHVGDGEAAAEAEDEPSSGDESDEATGGDSTAAAPAQPAPSDRRSPLQVVGWRAVPARDGQGVEIFGVLLNDGTTTLREIGLTVRLLAEDGAELADSPAALSTRILGPAGQANFRASFPGLLEAPGARFEASGEPVR